jgi:hypothetical protein
VEIPAQILASNLDTTTSSGSKNYPRAVPTAA